MTNREQYDTVNLSKNDKKENNLDKMDKHKRLYQNTKFLVDIIFVAEILITLIMPFSIPWLNRNFSLFFLAFVFCRVVALVFQEAVRHKEENDLTI